MRFPLIILGAVGLTAAGLYGCAKAPGRPVPSEMPIVPSEISDFSTLYEAELLRLSRPRRKWRSCDRSRQSRVPGDCRRCHPASGDGEWNFWNLNACFCAERRRHAYR